jgi:hypothetical protein
LPCSVATLKNHPCRTCLQVGAVHLLYCVLCAKMCEGIPRPETPPPTVLGHVCLALLRLLETIPAGACLLVGAVHLLFFTVCYVEEVDWDALDRLCGEGHLRPPATPTNGLGACLPCSVATLRKTIPAEHVFRSGAVHLYCVLCRREVGWDAPDRL